MGPREQIILARHVDWSNITNLSIVKVGFDLFSKVLFILDDSGNDQRQSTQASNSDRQMDTLVWVNPPDGNQVITARLLERVQRDIDPVVHGRQVVQPRRAIGVADGNEVSVPILLVDRHNSRGREPVDRGQYRSVD